MQDIGVRSKFLRGAGVVTRELGFLQKVQEEGCW